MRVHMSYGRNGLPLELPDDWDVTVIRKPSMPVLPDPAAAVRGALKAPVGSPALAEAARGRRSACILICDVTRPVPNALILRPMIETLHAAGIPPGAVTVLVATGLHRPNEGEELARLVGDPWVPAHARVENHFARDGAAHVSLGATAAGIPVLLDRRFVEADLRIATGLVEPHFMAGWSGGRKLITPGVAHRDTITAFHAWRLIGHPSAANCVLDGNPVHAAQMEIASMVGRVFALNTVLDEGRRLSFVSFGELAASHRTAVAFMERFAAVEVPRRFPVVVTTAAGHPLDATYYQTVKGMVGAAGILEPGGRLIIASSCSEGFGSAEFRAAQRRLAADGPERFLSEAGGKDRADIDEWQTALLAKTLRAGTVHLFTGGLGAEDRAITGVRMAAPSLAETVAACRAEAGGGAVAVIPEGPYVIPRCGSRELTGGVFLP